MRPHRHVLRGPALTIRPGRDDDAAAFITLIETCWSAYPNCPLDVDAEAPELRALASYYAAQGGAVWIADAGSGMIATRPVSEARWEICRVYVMPLHHGSGRGADLLAHAERHARGRGAAELELWTDTRFTRAHRFYIKHGYRRTGERRALHDLADTLEDRYLKAAAGLG